MSGPPCHLALAALLAVATAASAADVPPAATVRFAPEMQAALDTTYGPSEGPVLEQTVRERVATALRREATCQSIAEVEITLIDARPTHPTDRQIGDNAALDRLRTHFAGGATFSARLLGADGGELRSLRYDWYAPDDRHTSKAAEPWGDVRLASEGLGSELARACRALAPAHPASP
jgi:hypothetical protein